MADRIINNNQGTRIANALGKVAENVSDYTATEVTPTDAMKGELISESNAERIVDALDSIKDGAVDVAHGGTGAKTASAARSNLGLGALATLDSVSASEVSGLGTAATKDYTTSISSGSSNLITSGAVYTALSNKMDIPSGSVGSANQVMYLNNGVFTAGNTLPSSVTVTTSMTSSSSSYAAAASLVYNRFVRAIAPVETGSTASSARAIGDLFIDNNGYLRRATSSISSGTSYSSKSVTTTMAKETKKVIVICDTATVISNGTTFSLTDSVSNYDFIIVEIYANAPGGGTRKFSTIDSYAASDQGYSTRYIELSVYYSSSYYGCVGLSIASGGKKLTVAEMSSNGYTSLEGIRVIGIKS